MNTRSATTPRVAVVGGSGFIGARLVARLAEEGERSRVVDVAEPRGPDPEWMNADVRDAARLRLALAGTETVYNLAAARGVPPSLQGDDHGLHVDGARAVCAVAAECGVRRIVYASSAAVYGRSASVPDEATPPAPAGAYATGKFEAEGIYRAWAAGDPARALVIVRPTVVFGPGARGVGDWMLKNAVKPGFVQVGQARCRKSLAFVDNLAAFLAFVRGTAEKVAIFNYADTPDLALGEIISIVRSALDLAPARQRSRAMAYASAAVASLSGALRGRERPRIRLGRFYQEVRFDATRAHRSGFSQLVPLREALVRTARADLRWIALVGRHL